MIFPGVITLSQPQPPHLTLVFYLSGDKGARGEKGETGVGDRGEQGPAGPIGNNQNILHCSCVYE